MPLTNCPDCGKEVSTLAPACPNCARPLVPAAPPQSAARELRRDRAARYNHVSWLLAGIAILCFVVGVWPLAALLGVAAVVLSIMYHVER